VSPFANQRQTHFCLPNSFFVYFLNNPIGLRILDSGSAEPDRGEGHSMRGISRRDVLKAGLGLSLTPAFLSISESSAWASDPYEGAKLVDGEPALPTSGAFTVVVLPDTQYYSESFPETFRAQTSWIVENQARRNIASVIHLGDVTNRNTPKEWENASKALSVLDGKVPYFLTLGNHDYSEGGSCRDRKTRLNDYFPVARYRDLPSFGGVYDQEPDRLDNSYHLFSAMGRQFMVLALEFGPRKDVVRWANSVVGQHRDKEVILVTHAYTYYDSTRYDWKRRGARQHWNPHSYAMAKTTEHDMSDGEELWNKLITRHENFVMTLNGHVLGDGLGRLVSATPSGRKIQQVLANFQMKPQGGDGWLRLMEFQPDGSNVQVYDYSPTRDQRNESPRNQFKMQLASIATA